MAITAAIPADPQMMLILQLLLPHESVMRRLSTALSYSTPFASSFLILQEVGLGH